MQTQVTKKIDFKDKDLFIGLDVHKKSWSVTIVIDGMEHRTFTQPPDPRALNNYLQRMFPGGRAAITVPMRQVFAVTAYIAN